MRIPGIALSFFRCRQGGSRVMINQTKNLYNAVWNLVPQAIIRNKIPDIIFVTRHMKKIASKLNQKISFVLSQNWYQEEVFLFQINSFVNAIVFFSKIRSFREVLFWKNVEVQSFMIDFSIKMYFWKAWYLNKIYASWASALSAFLGNCWGNFQLLCQISRKTQFFWMVAIRIIFRL